MTTRDATLGANVKATGYAGIADVVERAKALGTLSGFALGAWLIKAYEVGIASERDRTSVPSEIPQNHIAGAGKKVFPDVVEMYDEELRRQGLDLSGREYAEEAVTALRAVAARIRSETIPSARRRITGEEMGRLMAQAGYDVCAVHPRCYEKFSYVSLFRLLGYEQPR